MNVPPTLEQYEGEHNDDLHLHLHPRRQSSNHCYCYSQGDRWSCCDGGDVAPLPEVVAAAVVGVATVTAGLVGVLHPFFYRLQNQLTDSRCHCISCCCTVHGQEQQRLCSWKKRTRKRRRWRSVRSCLRLEWLGDAKLIERHGRMRWEQRVLSEEEQH